MSSAITSGPDSSHPGGAAPDPAAGRRRSRSRQSVLDMVRTMVVIGAAVAVVYILTVRPTKVTQPAPDVAAAVSAAAADLGTTGHPARLMNPKVPADWRSNAATWGRQGPDNTATLHVGYLTGSQQYAAMDVTATSTKDWLNDITHNGSPQGNRTIAGHSWQQYVAEDGRRSLALTRSGRQVGLNADLGGRLTTVVSGTVTQAQLDSLAAAAVRPGAAVVR